VPVEQRLLHSSEDLKSGMAAGACMAKILVVDDDFSDVTA